MTTELDIDEELAFAASAPESLDFTSEEFVERVGEGFNEHGVRTNETEDGDLHSVDVIFAAMEPGPPERRNGVRITESFLKNVASKNYDSEPPHLLNHNKRDTFSKIGDVKEVWYSDLHEKLFIQARVPNTGGPTHTEAIARYTFEPPSIRDGSIGLGNDYTVVKNAQDEPELQDGSLQEFSAVNFPGGYDDGGVAPAFAEAATEAVQAGEFDDSPQGQEAREGDGDENSAASDFSVDTETVTF